MGYIWISIALALLVVIGLLRLRLIDARNEESNWQELILKAGISQGFYKPELVQGLPEPAQRYFNFSISPGSPLVPAVEIEMHGELGLGSIDEPKYKPMKARQILAPPHGLLWCVRVGLVRGSDGVNKNDSWTRFWLFGLIPIVRVGDNQDHHRSALGRVIAEAAFWTPAALMPSERVIWEAVDDNTARAIVSFGGFKQAVDITVLQNGQPYQVVIQRWSNENSSHEYKIQPFGGTLGDFRRFGGYMLPTSVEGGNHFGTGDYFPFYRAKVTDIRLLGNTV
jgi:hypothetical protein